MFIDLFVLNSSDPSKVEYSDSLDVGGSSFVPRVGDFMCIPGSAKHFVVRRVLVSWVAVFGCKSEGGVMNYVPRVRVDLGFVPVEDCPDL